MERCWWRPGDGHTSRHWTYANYYEPEEGRFVFPGLPVGVYELHAELAGFEPLGFPNVSLTVNETTAVSLVMKVAA